MRQYDNLVARRKTPWQSYKIMIGTLPSAAGNDRAILLLHLILTMKKLQNLLHLFLFSAIC